MKIETCHLNGVKTFAFVSKDELLDYVVDRKAILIAINAEKILHSKQELTEIIENNIGYADGFGAVWALKNHGYRKAKKIPGCELWLDIIKKNYRNKSFYLIGSKHEIIESTVSKLKQEFKGINILNYRDGFLNSEAEKSKLFRDLQIKKPDVVFVAAGSPYQEFLMNEMQDYHQALYMGLGGSFDVYTGKVKRAPDFWLNIHMEWFYRLMMQPSRIKRQVHLLRFAYLNIVRKI